MFNASEDKLLGVPEGVEKSCFILSLGPERERRWQEEIETFVMSCYIPLGSYVYRDNDSDSLGLLL